MSIESVFEKYGESTVKDLRQSFARNNVNASDRLSESVEDKVITDKDSISLQVSMFRYGLTAEDGRGPTRKGGTGDLRKRIRRWIDEKGIQGSPKEKDSMSYAITKKIHKEGTVKFRNPSKRDQSVSSVINENLVDEIVNDVADEVAKDVADSIVARIKNKSRNGNN